MIYFETLNEIKQTPDFRQTKKLERFGNVCTDSGRIATEIRLAFVKILNVR